jgi:hypothetical protein
LGRKISSPRFEEDAEGHAYLYAIERGSDDVADHAGAFRQLDDCDDVRNLAGPAAPTISFFSGRSIYKS